MYDINYFISKLFFLHVDRTLSDVSHISNINASCVNESMCNSVLNSKLEPTLDNLDVSAFQAPEDLLDGCRVCLYCVINAGSGDVC